MKFFKRFSYVYFSIMIVCVICLVVGKEYSTNELFLYIQNSNIDLYFNNFTDSIMLVKDNFQNFNSFTQVFQIVYYSAVGLFNLLLLPIDFAMSLINFFFTRGF